MEQNSPQNKTILKLDWCTRRAAELAVMRWHYSKVMPKSKNIYIGVWENDKFVGVVIFGLGGGSATSGMKYGLERSFQMAELVRIALTKHATPVSRIVSIAIRMLKKQSPGIRCLISFADPAQNHHGGIYQASGWIYTGTTPPSKALKDSLGKLHHERTVSNSGIKKHFGNSVRVRTWQSGTIIQMPGKHRYLFPLDDEIRTRVQALKKPYPKRALQVTPSTRQVSNLERAGKHRPQRSKSL